MHKLDIEVPTAAGGVSIAVASSTEILNVAGLVVAKYAPIVEPIPSVYAIAEVSHCFSLFDVANAVDLHQVDVFRRSSCSVGVLDHLQSQDGRGLSSQRLESQVVVKVQNNVPKVQADLGFGDGIGVLVNQLGDLCKVSKGRQQSK